MAVTDYLIAAKVTGADPDDWTVVETLLSGISRDISSDRALGWEFQQFSKYVKMADGQYKGLGFPTAAWIFKGLRVEQREAMRDYVTGTSAEVYIRTPTNETVDGVRVWKDYVCLVHWVQRSEIIQDGIDYAEMVELRFTHLVEVEE